MIDMNALKMLKEASEGLHIHVNGAEIGFDVNGSPLLTFTALSYGHEVAGVVHLPASRKDLRSILASKVIRSACRP
jgi:hypothetical protein